MSRKGIFFPDTAFVRSFYIRPIGETMTRTDVRAPRIPASNLFYLKSDYINDRKTSTRYT